MGDSRLALLFASGLLVAFAACSNDDDGGAAHAELAAFESYATTKYMLPGPP